MGFILPSSESPAEQARTLMARKDAIEAELQTHISVLQANSSTMHSPLVDSEGFPREDINVWDVRMARVRIIELRNDLEGIMTSIEKALQGVYDPSLKTATSYSAQGSDSPHLRVFAKVNGVAPGSPAADAGLQREDQILKFGSLTAASFEASSLQPLAELVNSNENRPLSIKILRSSQEKFITLTPRSGWGGRGLLGCHIVPSS